MTSSKSNKAQQTAAADVVAAQNQAKQELISAGQAANKQITEAGQPTETEANLQKTYATKTSQPAEELLTSAGPISQAVANRVAEGVNNPGGSYDVASINESVGNPVWASLKARGIAAQPGDTSGGGLGTEQYMQQMVPYLAEGKQAQANTDIQRGTDYTTAALAQQNVYTQLEDALAQALGTRKYSAGVAGAGAEQSGVESGAPQGVAATQTNQAEVDKRYAQKAADNAALGNALVQLLGGDLTGTASALTASATPTSTTTGTTTKNNATVANQGVSNSTLDKQLQARMASFGMGANMNIWSGIAQGAGDIAKKRSEQNADMNKTKYVADREQALTILKQLAEGNIKPAGEGETPILSVPGEPTQSKSLLKRVLGLQEPGQTQNYVTGNNPEKMAQTMKNALLAKEYETAMGGGKSTITSPTVKENVTGVPTTSTTTTTPATKGKPEPFVQVQTGVDKYGNPEYTTKDNPDYKLYEKEQEKTIEFDVKKKQLRNDLTSFFAVDDKIDRAKGGFIGTRAAGLKSQYRAIAQPIDKATNKPSIEGTAARVHDAAAKRLRVQLVRAAGDVGNINIVEQEAAEKLIPGFYDSEESARVKRAYLTQIAKAIDSGDANEVKKALDQASIGYIDIGTNNPEQDVPTNNGEKANQPANIPNFNSEQEAEASGIKGIVTINGRRARID